MAKLPEEFAPTGPKLSRLPVRPAPPIRPRLFADEARFAGRLALLVFGTELAAWAWLARTRGAVALGLAALRLLRPLWAFAGTRLPRPLVGFALLAVALAGQGAALFSLGSLAAAAALAAGLPALGDLAATTIADTITVERRAAAHAFLDMGQALGVALGLALGAAAPSLVPAGAAVALFAAGAGVPDLHDRGTPRSSWPAGAFAAAARTPLTFRLLVFAAATSGLSFAARPWVPGALTGWWATWILALAPLAGMALAARLAERAPNAVLLPRALCAAALFSLLLRGQGGGLLALFTLGAAATALPSAVARGAGELERPLSSSLGWTALALGAGAGALLGG